MANPKSGIPWTGLSGISLGGGRVRPDWNAGGSSALSTQISSVYSAGSPLMHVSTKTFTVNAQTITPQSILTTFSYPGLVIGDCIILNQALSGSTWSGPVIATAYCAADNVLSVSLSAATALSQTIRATDIRATRLSFASG